MAQNTVRILGIESSCDETAAAVVENGRRIVSDFISTQIDIHKQYGGVFPEVASRQHVLAVYPVIDEVMTKAHMSYSDIDAIAVTRGPGLAGSLVVGMNAAKGLALATGLPLIGINHLEGHIYSSWVYSDRDEVIPQEPEFPAIVLLVSGGHSEVILLRDHLQYERLGGTLDDAAGEAFDKTARLLGLEYPGGPSIQKASQGGDPDAYKFHVAKMPGTYDFSFSGVKTSVLRTVQKLEKEGQPLNVADLAASFQKSVVSILFEKTMRAAREYNAKNIVIAGGVSANKCLRDTFLTEQSEFRVFIPKLSYCTDNGAMIGAAGYRRYLAGQFDSLDMDVFPNWPLSRINNK
ncbi:MAG: tRNA (adenosine(37)-N6)-threonylcarbamoyltransferase complex transferase subunit TsaD [Anaerolineaceae bacterium]|nr:tRNA (adenosine(37)-N6)-threonylcarbamoyltransferase complex transferase subunit TsaD [Anaerolineaceae bacterium]